MLTEADDIIKYKVFPDFILILFGNGSLRKLERKSLYDPKDFHTEKITNDKIWKTAKASKGSIYWTGYKVFGQPYAISSETAYRLSKPVTKKELLFILQHLQNKIHKIKIENLIKDAL